MNKKKDIDEAIEALNDLIEHGGFRLGSKLDYKKCFITARTILEFCKSLYK